MWVDNDVRGIVVAILKMATGRNFSMSGINSRHYNLPTYQIVMISDNVDFSTGCHFQNAHQNIAKIQHCAISSQFNMWVDNDVPN
jgi:putative Mn2+ efflux pump MntP